MTTTEKESNNYSYLVIIFLVSVTAIIVVFATYFYKFNDALSSEQELWGSFGDFIGGTLNPILSFLALLALLITIAIQSKQLFLSRKELELTKNELAKTAKATVRQVKHLENQAKRTDIYRIFETLSKRINNNYNENRIDDSFVGSNKTSIHAVLKEGNDITTNVNLEMMSEHYKNTKSDTFRTIKWLESDLERLSYYIYEYEATTDVKGSSTPFPEFYKSEFDTLVSVLYELNMIEQGIYEFYCA